MYLTKSLVSRRDFLKLSAASLAGLTFLPISISERLNKQSLLSPEFPSAELLGRNCTADTSLEYGGTIPVMSRPDINSSKTRDSYRDEVFPWIQEVSAENLDLNISNQRWVETPDGYVRSNQLQPCRNSPNVPINEIPAGQSGFWGEVTVPYVDLYLENPAPVSGWMKDHTAYGLQPRLYYSQVMWVDAIKVSGEGSVLYHINEKYGNPNEQFWADGTAFRPLTEEEISPISPDVDPAIKKVVVNLIYQTLTCLEDKKEVYFCRVSTGIQPGSTPMGEQAIWRKLISVRMGANTVAASYDLPGISWTTLFNGTGVAIHGATSHNDFGTVRSHGCVNCKPEDAKWVFRWTLPVVSLNPGEVTWSDWTSGSTHVIVEDTL